MFSALRAVAAPVAWQERSPGLEWARLSLPHHTIFSADVVLVRATLSDFRIGVVYALDYGSRRTDVRTLSKASKAVAGINANFFDEQGHPLGLIISRGIVRQRMHQGGTTLTGVFYASRSGVGIVNRADFSSTKTLEALQAGPRLLAHGKPVQGLRKRYTPRKRAGVCIDKSNRIVFFTVSSWLLGLPLADLQEFLSGKSVECVDALNLDGGGSSQLYLSLSQQTRALPTNNPEQNELYVSGDDDVPVMLGLFQR